MGVKWLDRPEGKDYVAAEDFLRLLYGPRGLRHVAFLFLRAEQRKWKAKDILRAAELPILTPAKSPEVRRKVDKIKRGDPLSPILLLSSAVGCMRIADGYHRVCAAYLEHEDELVPARLVYWTP